MERAQGTSRRNRVLHTEKAARRDFIEGLILPIGLGFLFLVPSSKCAGTKKTSAAVTY